MTFWKNLTIALLLSSAAAHADMLGGEISAGIFNHTPSGTASYNGPDVDVKKDLGWDTENDVMLKAYFEHPLPFIPNIKIAYSSLDHSGHGSIEDFRWGDINFAKALVDTSLTLRMYDATLYYEVLDNIVEADVGITLRYLDGNIDVTATPLVSGLGSLAPTYETSDFNTLAPMLYGKIRVNIPATDISTQIEANGVSYDGTTLYDIELSARYTFTAGVGLEAGYRLVHLDSDDIDDLAVDVDFKGVYAALVWDF